MNPLMEVYSYSKNVEKTYEELLALEPWIKTEGERAIYNLNKANLLYDMYKYEDAADIIREIKPLNPEFDSRCAQTKTKIMDALNKGEHR